MVNGHSVQVNIPAESGEMGVLANHVPSIEQLKPGVVEIIEESGGSKQFFCTLGHLKAHRDNRQRHELALSFRTCLERRLLSYALAL